MLTARERCGRKPSDERLDCCGPFGSCSRGRAAPFYTFPRAGRAAGAHRRDRRREPGGQLARSRATACAASVPRAKCKSSGMFSAALLRNDAARGRKGKAEGRAQHAARGFIFGSSGAGFLRGSADVQARRKHGCAYSSVDSAVGAVPPAMLAASARQVERHTQAMSLHIFTQLHLSRFSCRLGHWTSTEQRSDETALAWQVRAHKTDL
jgi:hypothetical protein